MRPRPGLSVKQNEDSIKGDEKKAPHVTAASRDPKMIRVISALANERQAAVDLFGIHLFVTRVLDSYNSCNTHITAIPHKKHTIPMTFPVGYL